MNFRRPLATVALVALAGGGCATGDKAAAYRAMDGEAKTVYLNLYPDLTPGQRKELLDGGSYLTPLKELKLDPDQFFKQRRTRAPIRLEIRAAAGDTELRAWLIYRDGRQAEVTAESLWSVQPPLVRLTDGAPVRASWGCVNSDAVVAAAFQGELEGKFTLRPRERVRTIEVSVDESSQSVEAAGSTTRLKAIARCAEGSSTEVSCQAEWKLAPDPDFPAPREIEGCGLYHHLDPRAEHARTRELKTERIVVDVAYGGARTRTTVQMPRRRD